MYLLYIYIYIYILYYTILYYTPIHYIEREYIERKEKDKSWTALKRGKRSVTVQLPVLLTWYNQHDTTFRHHIIVYRMIPSNCIIVTNVPPATPTQQLIDHIQLIGNIVSCIRKPYTSKAVVELYDCVTAEKMVRLLNCSVIDGIRINVMLYIDDNNNDMILNSDSEDSTLQQKYSLPFDDQHMLDSNTTAYLNKDQSTGNILLQHHTDTTQAYSKPCSNDGIPCDTFISDSIQVLEQHVYHTYDDTPIGSTLLNNNHILYIWNYLYTLCQHNTNRHNESFRHEHTVKTEPSAQSTDNHTNLQLLGEAVINELFQSAVQHHLPLNYSTVEYLRLHKQHYSVTTHPAGAEYILLCTRVLNDQLNISFELTPCYLIHLPDLSQSIQSCNTMDTNIYLLNHTYFLVPNLSTCILLGTLAAESGTTTHGKIYYRLWCYDILLYNNQLLHSYTLQQRLDTALQQLFTKQSLSLISTAHRLIPSDIVDGYTRLHGTLSTIHTDISLCRMVHCMDESAGGPQVGLFGNSSIYPIVKHYTYHYQTQTYDEHIQQQLLYLTQLPYTATHIMIYYNGSINNKHKLNNNNVTPENNVQPESNVIHQSTISTHTTQSLFPLSYLYSPLDSDISRADLLRMMKRDTVKVETP